jgi:hypothetical protein
VASRDPSYIYPSMAMWVAVLMVIIKTPTQESSRLNLYHSSCISTNDINFNAKKSRDRLHHLSVSLVPLWYSSVTNI